MSERKPVTVYEYRRALNELLQLSNHYAKLLNDWDGGERQTFENGDAWIERLREVGTFD